jgi:hypothetical protein
MCGAGVLGYDPQRLHDSRVCGGGEGTGRMREGRGVSVLPNKTMVMTERNIKTGPLHQEEDFISLELAMLSRACKSISFISSVSLSSEALA